MKRFGLILALIVVIAGAGLSYAGGPGKPPSEDRGRGRHPRFEDQLTEEQREAIHEMVTEMREAGATREEIHDAVKEKLDSWGIEPPEHREGPPGPHGRLGKLLSEEQREAIHAMVTEMRDAGATREEIHDAVEEKLDSWGIEPPPRGEGPPPPPGDDDGAEASLQSPGQEESATWGLIKEAFH